MIIHSCLNVLVLGSNAIVCAGMWNGAAVLLFQYENIHSFFDDLIAIESMHGCHILTRMIL